MFYEWYWISLSDPMCSAARELTAARNPILIGDGIIWKGTCHEPDQPWCRKTKPSEHASWYIPRTMKIGNGHRDICHVANHGSWLGLCALKPSVIHYNPLAVWVVIPFLLKRKKSWFCVWWSPSDCRFIHFRPIFTWLDDNPIFVMVDQDPMAQLASFRAA